MCTVFNTFLINMINKWNPAGFRPAGRKPTGNRPETGRNPAGNRPELKAFLEASGAADLFCVEANTFLEF